MLFSHNVCPICEAVLGVQKYVDEPCSELDKTRLTYTKNYCNGFQSRKAQPEHVLPPHLFRQISCFRQLFYYAIQFPNISADISVNYVRQETIISYLHPNKNESIVIPQKLWKVDFPLCQHTINRIKNLTPFL